MDLSTIFIRLFERLARDSRIPMVIKGLKRLRTSASPHGGDGPPGGFLSQVSVRGCGVEGQGGQGRGGGETSSEAGSLTSRSR